MLGEVDTLCTRCDGNLWTTYWVIYKNIIVLLSLDTVYNTRNAGNRNNNVQVKRTKTAVKPG